MKDGHGPGLKAFIRKEQLEKEEVLKILTMKHASSISSITQSADIGRQFAILKQTSKKATSINVPSGFGLKGILKDELNRPSKQDPTPQNTSKESNH